MDNLWWLWVGVGCVVVGGVGLVVVGGEAGDLTP